MDQGEAKRILGKQWLLNSHCPPWCITDSSLLPSTVILKRETRFSRDLPHKFSFISHSHLFQVFCLGGGPFWLVLLLRFIHSVEGDVAKTMKNVRFGIGDIYFWNLVSPFTCPSPRVLRDDFTHCRGDVLIICTKRWAMIHCMCTYVVYICM